MKTRPKYHWVPELPGKHYPRLDHTKLPVVHIDSIIDMSSHMSAIENQHSLGSCTSHAIVGMMEYLQNYAAGFANDHFQFEKLSRLFVYFNERFLEGTIKKDAGALISDGMKSLVRWGICKESLWPYKIRQYKKQPPPEAFAEAVTRRIKEYAKVDQTEEAIEATLAAGFPIVFGMTIYTTFESDEVAASGFVPMPECDIEECLGGHALLIVGYNRITRMLKIRNSWGPEWGDKGYFYVSIDYILDRDLADDFWTVIQ